MPYFFEANESPYQSTLETASRDNRPPQLNRTICGCRCGCGCGVLEGEDGGGNENDEDAPSTPDGPEDHVTVESFEVQPFHQNNETPELHIVHEGFLVSNERFGIMPHVIMEEQPLWLHRRPVVTDDEKPDSMKNEPLGSDDHSVASSDMESVRCMSPGPGIGTWMDEARTDGYGCHYHFSTRPLRLTPQRRYCRGLVASHLVLNDEDYMNGAEDLREGV